MRVTLIRATEELFVYSPDGGLLVGFWWAFGWLLVGFRERLVGFWLAVCGLS